MEKEDAIPNSVRASMEQHVRDASRAYAGMLPALSSVTAVIQRMQPQLALAVKTIRDNEALRTDATNALSLLSALRVDALTKRSDEYAGIFVRPQRPVTRQEISDIIERQLTKYFPTSTPTAHIDLSLSQSGRLERAIGGSMLTHAFIVGSNRAKIVFYLQEKRGKVPSQILVKYLQTTERSFYTTIKKINEAVGARLQLPPDQNFIVGERGLGYHINPLYRIVTVD